MDYHTRDAVITHVYKNLSRPSAWYPGATPHSLFGDMDEETTRSFIAEKVDELLRVFVPESFTSIHAYDPTKKVLTLSWTGSAELIRIRMETVVEVAMGATEPLSWGCPK